MQLELTKINYFDDEQGSRHQSLLYSSNMRSDFSSVSSHANFTKNSDSMKPLFLIFNAAAYTAYLITVLSFTLQ